MGFSYCCTLRPLSQRQKENKDNIEGGNNYITHKSKPHKPAQVGLDLKQMLAYKVLAGNLEEPEN